MTDLRTAQDPGEPSHFLRLGDDIVVEHLTVRARDGVSLAVDVYRPAQAGTYPALYAVCPYRKNLLTPAWRSKPSGHRS